MADPLPKYAIVDASNPTGWAVCDRCGFWRNRSDLKWQYEFGGMHLYNLEILVCADRCADVPQEQLRTIIIPPDPPPIVNARVPNYDYEEQTVIQLQTGSPKGVNNLQPPWNAGPQQQLCNQNGTELLIYQYQDIVQIS
jgi:hypothetical protein